jgi:hypothetical protein
MRLAGFRGALTWVGRSLVNQVNVIDLYYLNFDGSLIKWLLLARRSSGCYKNELCILQAASRDFRSMIRVNFCILVVKSRDFQI